MNHNFLYHDEETGEQFFVQLNDADFDTLEDMLTCADEIAQDNYEEPVYDENDMTDEEAEILGYDTL